MFKLIRTIGVEIDLYPAGILDWNKSGWLKSTGTSF